MKAMASWTQVQILQDIENLCRPVERKFALWSTQMRFAVRNEMQINSTTPVAGEWSGWISQLREE